MFQIHILQLSFHLTDSKGIKKSDSMFTIALNIKIKVAIQTSLSD